MIRRFAISRELAFQPLVDKQTFAVRPTRFPFPCNIRQVPPSEPSAARVDIMCRARFVISRSLADPFRVPMSRTIWVHVERVDATARPPGKGSANDPLLSPEEHTLSTSESRATSDHPLVEDDDATDRDRQSLGIELREACLEQRKTDEQSKAKLLNGKHLWSNDTAAGHIHSPHRDWESRGRAFRGSRSTHARTRARRVDQHLDAERIPRSGPTLATH